MYSDAYHIQVAIWMSFRAVCLSQGVGREVFC